MNASNIIKIINNFKDANLLVIGDLMLDKYLWGQVSRISPEAPVQIVNVNNEDFSPGGAANVAVNITSFGARSAIVGLVGNDEAGKLLVGELKKRGVDTKGIMIDPNRPTTTKIRVLAHNQQLIRMDYERTNGSDEEICARMINFVKSTISEYGAVIISDYSKGVVTKELVDNLRKLCSIHGKKLIVDPKPINMDLYQGAYIITPNHVEAHAFVGVKENNSNKSIMQVGEKIQQKLGANVLITRGGEGMILFEKGSNPFSISAKAREVYDVTGAGDTVTACLGLAISSGSDLKNASLISNYAAGIVVGKIGTSQLSHKELVEVINKDNG